MAQPQNGTFMRWFLGDTGGKPVANATSDGLSSTSDVTEYSNKDSGLGTYSFVSKQNQEISIEADMAWIDTSTTKTTWKACYDMWLAHLPITINGGVIATEDSTTFIVGSTKFTGTAIITSIDQTAPHADKSTFSMTLAVQGLLTASTVV